MNSFLAYLVCQRHKTTVYLKAMLKLLVGHNIFGYRTITISVFW